MLDPGCGNGIWGKALVDLYPEDGFIPNIYGIDISIPQNMAHACVNRNLYKMDFLDFVNIMGTGFELIMGNPPYSLAEEFVRHSLYLVAENGYVFFLLRLAFLESMKRCKGLFTEFPPKRVYVLARRPSFFTTKTGGRTTDALSYAMLLWQKGWQGKTELQWMNWEYNK